MQVTFDYDLYRDDDLYELSVTYIAQPRDEYLDIHSITHQGENIELSGAEEAQVLNACWERLNSDLQEYRDAEADYRYEEARDREMFDDRD